MNNRQQPRRGAPVYNALKTPSFGDQALAAANGAGDSLPFGLGNATVAAIRAAGDYSRGADFGRALQARLAAEQAQDRYDAAHMAGARLTGQVAGTGLQLATAGLGEGLFLGGSRMMGATGLALRDAGGLAALAGAGAGAGIAGQGLGDLVRGRLASPGDYAGAALGGAVGGLGVLTGSGAVAGALAGATTNAAQSGIRGQSPSASDVMRGATEGGWTGAAGGIVGRHWSDTAPMKIKQQIGETVARARTALRGETASQGNPTRYYLNNRKYTYPDHRVLQNGDTVGLVEAKFGRSYEKLKGRQAEAQQQLGDRYRLDHVLPQDVGAALGLPIGQVYSSVGRNFRNGD